MTSSTLFRFALALVVATSACGGDTVAPSPATLDGTWVRLDDVAGSGERWDLAVQGSTISGTGTWSGEACCSGTLTLSGVIAGDSIHVDLTVVITNPSPTRTTAEHFDGALASRTLLRGMRTVQNGSPGEERFRKQ